MMRRILYDHWPEWDASWPKGVDSAVEYTTAFRLELGITPAALLGWDIQFSVALVPTLSIQACAVKRFAAANSLRDIEADFLKFDESCFCYWR